MKAAVLYESNKPLVLDELELPELKPGQVLAKIIYTGLCRAQVNEIKAHKGPDMYLPHTLGHEASAIIEEIGSSVTKVKKGDYVVLTWIKGKGIDVPNCEYTAVKSGEKINSGAITTFNQYSVISENRVVKIPEEVPPEVAALLGCAIPTGAGIVRNDLKAKEGDSVAIFGIGGVGSSALLAAVAAGANPIIAIDNNDSKLEFAKENGAHHIINSDKEDIFSKLNELVEGGKVDYSIDCAGIPALIETAFEIIKDSGKTVIAGNPAKGETIKITPFDLIKGKQICGTWGGSSNTDEDIPFYATQFLEGKLRIDKLISKTYSLDEINQAIEDLNNGKVIRALIKM